MRCVSWWGLIVALPLLVAGQSLRADPPAPGTAVVSGLPGERFLSIQAAVDAAPRGAVIEIGAGHFDERLKITKPITLVGAGTDKTVIGPSVETRTAELAAFLARIQLIAEQFKAAGNPLANPKILDEQAGLPALGVPIIQIDGAAGVELRSLRVTSPGNPRPVRVGSPGGVVYPGFDAVALNNAEVRLTDCAVVGCLGDGVHADGQSNLEIDDCLIAGCWGGGVCTTKSALLGRVTISNSDVRNCGSANITVGGAAGVAMIEDCRISRSAMAGIHVRCQSTIARNAIFENGLASIVAEGDASIKQNLIYKNYMGLACCPGTRCWINGNLFMRNGRGEIGVFGSAEPMVRRNVFVRSMWAVEYDPQVLPSLFAFPLTGGTYYVRENLFWEITHPVLRRDTVGKRGDVETAYIELPGHAKNREEDPQITIDADGQVAIAENSPARTFEFADIAVAATKTRWPLTDEERAMLYLEDGTRDWKKWQVTRLPMVP